jgi:hypothetical protein
LAEHRGARYDQLRPDAHRGTVEVRGGRLHVDALEPPGTRHLRYSLRIMDITLVDPGREHALGVTGAYALNRKVASDHTVIEECR